jgi:hypothetical protein
MTDIFSPKIRKSEMAGRGNEAVLVLSQARTTAGDPTFFGSAAECVRLAAIKLDAVAKNAALLLATVRPPERILKRIDEVPELHRRPFRERMCKDFDAAIAKLTDTAESIRKQRGLHAVKAARNWANAKPKAERLGEIARTFEAAHEDAKQVFPSPGHVYVRAPRPTPPVILSTGSGSRATKDT